MVKISRIGGDFLGWNTDGKSIHWSLDPYFNVEHRRGREGGEGFHGEGGSSSAGAKPDTSVKPAPAYSAASRRGDHRAEDRPRSAPHGAKIILMKGNEVIENGDVLVNGTRIAAVGAADALPCRRERRRST